MKTGSFFAKLFLKNTSGTLQRNGKCFKMKKTTILYIKVLLLPCNFGLSHRLYSKGKGEHSCKV